MIAALQSLKLISACTCTDVHKVHVMSNLVYHLYKINNQSLSLHLVSEFSALIAMWHPILYSLSGREGQVSPLIEVSKKSNLMKKTMPNIMDTYRKERKVSDSFTYPLLKITRQTRYHLPIWYTSTHLRLHTLF